MISKASTILAIIAIAEARFSQEQVPVGKVSALSNFGKSGEAATLAGGIPSVLLAAASPCDKLTLADKIVTTLGNDPQVISAAVAVVAAEQNFNPFVVSIPNICADASLPATPELRGVVPLIDPAVTGSDTENANSATSVKAPFTADGLSVADIMVAQGFSNFTAVAADGTKSSPGGAAAGGKANSGKANSGKANGGKANGGNANAGNGNVNTGNGTAVATSAAASATTSKVKCGGAAKTSAAAAATSTAASSSNNNAGAKTGAGATTGAGAVTNAATGNFEGFQASSLGLDFGTCTPTIKFEESLNGRKAGEFTFQAIDPAVNKGQQEALNPAIILNRICDQLSNVCGAAADAKAACLKAKTDITALGTRDASTANAWNEALGFAGANINPDNAPQAGLVGHT